MAEQSVALAAGTPPETLRVQEQADGFTPPNIYERSVECGDDYDFPSATDEEAESDWWL